jgi:hypothetical protein
MGLPSSLFLVIVYLLKLEGQILDRFAEEISILKDSRKKVITLSKGLYDRV